MCRNSYIYMLMFIYMAQEKYFVAPSLRESWLHPCLQTTSNKLHKIVNVLILHPEHLKRKRSLTLYLRHSRWRH